MESFLNLFRKPVLKPQRSTDEAQRLEELYAQEILDSLPEQEFEDLVDLAAQVSGCPIASITFIDKDRQWFKASRGLPLPETHRDVSFCTHTIALEGDLVVEDARKDQRFATNPFVTAGLEVVFYAGTPIYSSNGYKLGTVCVLDQKTRHLSAAQMKSLRTIARQVTHLLDLRLRTRILQQRSERLLAENQKSFDAFFANDALPKWIYELETLRILQVNEVAIARYGYSHEEFERLTIFDIRDQNEPDFIKQQVQALNDGQPSVSFETRHRIKNGKLIPVQVRLSNIIYGGRPARLATMTELTEKRSSSQTVGSGSKDAGIAEQTPLGAEVHSNLKEALSTTKLYLDVAAGNSEMQEEMIRLSRENIGGALKELRLLERTGTITGDFNLLRSLDDLINNHQRRSSFQINLAGSDIEELPDDIKITVFRLIEQALDQSSKAGASRAAVDIQNTDAVSVAITDNRKRNAEIISDPGSAAIRNRVAFYNGKLESGPIPEGYRLFVELPSKPV